MTLIFCPSFVRVEDAIDWFDGKGYAAPKLWRGPDGLIRGSAEMRTSFGVCTAGLHALVEGTAYMEPRRKVVHCRECTRTRNGYVKRKTCGKCGGESHNRRGCRK